MTQSKFTRRFIASAVVLICLSALTVGCSKPGSDSAKRADGKDSAKPEVPVPPPPVPGKLDTSTVDQTGWKEFDDYFQQLQVVFAEVTTGDKKISESDFMTLKNRAATLADDASEAYKSTIQPRKDLALMIGEMSKHLETPKNLPPDAPSPSVMMMVSVLNLTQGITGPLDRKIALPYSIKLSKMINTLQSMTLPSGGPGGGPGGPGSPPPPPGGHR